MSGSGGHGAARPRLGFVGVGWIGRHRMEAIVRSELAEVVAVCDPSEEAARGASALAPGCRIAGDLAEVLGIGVDGVVIATPSAAHSAQAVTALRSGAAVFCQKPLGRNARETLAVVEAARASNRLLGVDLSYRHVEGLKRIQSLVASGELGAIYAANLVFHNAYGPDKPWFYDPALSGGGCVMDLGIHLVDLALWLLAPARVTRVQSLLFSGGRPLTDGRREVEDFAAVQLEMDTGTAVQLACSWRLPAGRDAIIEASFYGTSGGAALRNVDGSFYDFLAERYRGTARETLALPPDAWGGRAAVEWTRQLASGTRFDPKIERAVQVAQVLDWIYGHEGLDDRRHGVGRLELRP